MGYVLKATRKLDSFRAKCAGKEELCIFEGVVPVGKTEAAWILVGIILSEMGSEGDGENGGKKSLGNCAQEIFDGLIFTERYYYADVEFSMDEEEPWWR